MEHYYYSEKQEQEHKRLFDEGLLVSYQECYAYINGKVVRYSEQQQANNGSNWDDAVYLGQGYYHHVENLMHNPAFDNMDALTYLKLNLESCKRMLNLPVDDTDKDVVADTDDWAEIIGA